MPMNETEPSSNQFGMYLRGEWNCFVLDDASTVPPPK